MEMDKCRVMWESEGEGEVLRTRAACSGTLSWTERRRSGFV